MQPTHLSHQRGVTSDATSSTCWCCQGRAGFRVQQLGGWGGGEGGSNIPFIGGCDGRPNIWEVPREEHWASWGFCC